MIAQDQNDARIRISIVALTVIVARMNIAITEKSVSAPGGATAPSAKVACAAAKTPAATPAIRPMTHLSSFCPSTEIPGRIMGDSLFPQWISYMRDLAANCDAFTEILHDFSLIAPCSPSGLNELLAHLRRQPAAAGPSQVHARDLDLGAEQRLAVAPDLLRPFGSTDAPRTVLGRGRNLQQVLEPGRAPGSRRSSRRTTKTSPSSPASWSGRRLRRVGPRIARAL